MPTQPTDSHPIRLTRGQQLTLNAWRWAAIRLTRVLDPHAVFEQAALHAVLACLRDIDEPLALLAYHTEAYPEFALITSVVPPARQAAIAYDILDAAFLLRWNELVAPAGGSGELPRLRPRTPPGDQLDRPGR